MFAKHKRMDTAVFCKVYIYSVVDCLKVVALDLCYAIEVPRSFLDSSNLLCIFAVILEDAGCSAKDVCYANNRVHGEKIELVHRS